MVNLTLKHLKCCNNKIFLSLRRTPRLSVIALNCDWVPIHFEGTAYACLRSPIYYITVYCSGEMLRSLVVGLACWSVNKWSVVMGVLSETILGIKSTVHSLPFCFHDKTFFPRYKWNWSSISSKGQAELWSRTSQAFIFRVALRSSRDLKLRIWPFCTWVL